MWKPVVSHPLVDHAPVESDQREGVEDGVQDRSKPVTNWSRQVEDVNGDASCLGEAPRDACRGSAEQFEVDAEVPADHLEPLERADVE
jgi:hypothetical protein